jgi:hypothetical protein
MCTKSRTERRLRSARGTWRHPYPLLRSSSARRMFMAIIRQVRFSMRSAFGSCVFAREYSFQICVPSGSFFCICSGDSALGLLLASLPKAGNMAASSSMPLRAASSGGERSMLPSGTEKSMGGRRVRPVLEGNIACLRTADDVARTESTRRMNTPHVFVPTSAAAQTVCTPS